MAKLNVQVSRRKEGWMSRQNVSNGKKGTGFWPYLREWSSSTEGVYCNLPCGPGLEWWRAGRAPGSAAPVSQPSADTPDDLGAFAFLFQFFFLFFSLPLLRSLFVFSSFISHFLPQKNKLIKSIISVELVITHVANSLNVPSIFEFFPLRPDERGRCCWSFFCCFGNNTHPYVRPYDEGVLCANIAVNWIPFFVELLPLVSSALNAGLAEKNRCLWRTQHRPLSTNQLNGKHTISIVCFKFNSCETFEECETSGNWLNVM